MQTQTCEIISAMPWRMGNGVSLVFGKIRVGQGERSGSPAEQMIACETFCLSVYLISLEATATRDPFAAAHAPLSIT